MSLLIMRKTLKRQKNMKGKIIGEKNEIVQFKLAIKIIASSHYKTHPSKICSMWNKNLSVSVLTCQSTHKRQVDDDDEKNT